MKPNKKAAASRRNSAKSTGPRTDTGKARCSLNALRHGLYASTLILPGENKENFDQLRARLHSIHQPQNAYEQDLVHQLAITEWKLLRAELIEGSVLAEHAGDPASAYLSDYASVSRIQARLRRDRFRLSQELERSRTARRREAQPQAENPSQKAAPPHPPKPPEPARDGPFCAVPQDDDEQWATEEEMQNQTGREKNYKRPKFLELWWTPVEGQPPKLISRVYKGKRVTEWPADDQPAPDHVAGAQDPSPAR